MKRRCLCSGKAILQDIQTRMEMTGNAQCKKLRKREGTKSLREEERESKTCSKTDL